MCRPDGQDCITRLDSTREHPMMRLFRRVVLLFARTILRLRYRVHIQGLDAVRRLERPLLIMPNHPGYVDPMLMLSFLGPALEPRPMLAEGNFQSPLMRLLMRLLNALRVPDLDQASSEARERAQKAVEETIQALRSGDNVILWPSGRLQRNHRGEIIGGARAASTILQAVPDAQVVLVRTRGVWGSSFTYAFTGQTPPMIRRILTGAAWLVASLFFFAPRREVNITVESIDRGALPPLGRDTLNPWLEAWYNTGGPEKPTFVRYHRLFGPTSHEYPVISGLGDVDLTRVKPATKAAVAEILADKLGRPLTEAEQRPETTLDQLGLDSLDGMELQLTVEQHFGFTGDQVPANLGQFWALAQGLIERAAEKPAPQEWFRPASDQDALKVHGETIAEAFVARVVAHPRDVAAADDVAGVLTYERFLVGALTTSRRFAELPEANVGLMLPSSVASGVAFMALHLAGKLPVVLNWTTGPANLAHAVRIMGLKHVVTSRRFIDRTGIRSFGAEFLFLEDLRQGFGRIELLRTLLGVRLFSGRIRKRLPAAKPEQPAVVLFTSGSEKAPKAVPLTHSNLLSNLRTGVEHLRLSRADSILGFLPAFHSFGMTGTMLLPLIGGMRAVYHADPTDAGGLARKIGGWMPTMLVGTPTFVASILDRARPNQLQSLRLIVVGAEKCPQSVFEQCARLAPAAALLEGYGITECSPVVAVNRPHANRPGSLGQALPGLEVCVVDLESDLVLPRDRQGMLLVNGPTVFPGYIGHDGPSPFQERDGKRWYVTGDLARIDAEGFIWFAGRLKRFIKAGGEMISLAALEEPFTRWFPPAEGGPRVAVEGVETADGRHIVLFCTEAISLQQANARLQQEGFRGVMRLDEVRRVDAVPVLGTGKTDYKTLRSAIAVG
jgi:acyl-CoA synthetase (AMP-forming)/AMP-acid ligase II/acyl carrier protein